MKGIFICMTLLSLTACGQSQINSKNDSLMKKFEEFKLKEKFTRDERIFYPGISEPELKPVLTKLVNLAAEDFKILKEKGKATDKDYQDIIKKGLDRFSDVYLKLDTEDKERVCLYFEELMDLVGLESSGGHLNRFIYGFDPTEFMKKE
jgi:hypothetical protein